MSVNTMSFEQSAAFLTALYQEATGQQPTIQIANTADFTTVGTSLLQAGYDPIIGALSQVLQRTIFSIRPYAQKFKDLNVTAEKWGAVTRKINFIDTALDNADDRLTLTDGSSIDPFIVKKPKVLQTNFYGATQYQDHITIFRDQLDSALKDAAEFGSFISGVLQNIADKLAQIKEAEARGILANFIAAKYGYDSPNAINVLQEYYNETGVTLTPVDMFNVTNYTAFSRWLAGYMATLADKMAERSLKYHMNITGKEIMRHTEGRFLKKYISANVANHIDAAVASGLYNEERVTKVLDGAERVTFWQNIEDPYSVDATPAYLDTATGNVVDALTDTLVENVIGVLFDEEALGTVTLSTWTAPSPFNPAGGYYNIYWHFTQKTWNDFTENFVLLYAGTVTP